MPTGSPIVPGVRYDDANAAVDFLTSVLGFTEHAVYRDDNGKVVHAELALGSGVIMVAPNSDTPWGRLMKTPAQAGGFNTQAQYLVVQDADAVFRRVQHAGWDIPIDIRDQPYGGRDFTCRDPGGHVWSVGTYDPWSNKAT